MPACHKNCKENKFTAYPAFRWNRIMTGATVSIKNTIIVMVFFTYKYLNMETKHLKIIST